MSTREFCFYFSLSLVWAGLMTQSQATKCIVFACCSFTSCGVLLRDCEWIARTKREWNRGERKKIMHHFRIKRVRNYRKLNAITKSALCSHLKLRITFSMNNIFFSSLFSNGKGHTISLNSSIWFLFMFLWNMAAIEREKEKKNKQTQKLWKILHVW